MVDGPGRAVVVGVGSAAGDGCVVAAAAREAVAREARLVVVHVVAPGTRPAVAVRRRVAAALAAARAAHPGLDVSLTVAVGDPVEELLSHRCDLLVTGHRRRTRRRVRRPSVAIGVTDRATVPVLVWPSGDGPRCPHGDGVLVAVDGRGDDTVVRFAFDEAVARRVPVVAEHVWSAPADGARRAPATPSADKARELVGAAVGAGRAGVAVRTVVRRSLDVAIALNATARSADLAVIGAHRGRVAGGGIRRALIQRGACPVAVVPVPDRPPVVTGRS
jgi:hypothetical protein